MKPSVLIRSLVPLAALFAGISCGGPIDDEGSDMRAGAFDESTSDSEVVTRRCGMNAIRGMDVSYYQGNIDWDRVSGTNIDFAFIRVSDGLANRDSKFARNWAESKRVGIRRGAYQFFRPNLDAVAQADLLLSMMGPLENGDLPPVIDVEVNGGLSASQVAAKVRTWIDRVEGELGVEPIVYTGPYFWQDNVGAPAFASSHPLWIAHYTTACPLVPNPWTQWTFHQYTDSGSVAGISGGVDSNFFNGTAAQLAALGFRGTPTPPDPTDPNTCTKIGTSGGVKEEDDSCVELGGPAQFLRSESGGSGGSHVWTGVTNSEQAANFARWVLSFQRSGLYRVEAYAEGATENTHQAGYRITFSGGSDQVFVNQTTSGGFVELGAFNFATSGDFSIRLDDNTGEASSLDRRAIFDAVRLTPISALPCGTMALQSGVSGLNVRSLPSTSGSILTVLSAGASFQRLATVSGDRVDTNSAWNRIRTGNTVGYVSARYTACQ